MPLRRGEKNLKSLQEFFLVGNKEKIIVKLFFELSFSKDLPATWKKLLLTFFFLFSSPPPPLLFFLGKKPLSMYVLQLQFLLVSWLGSGASWAVPGGSSFPLPGKKSNCCLLVSLKSVTWELGHFFAGFACWFGSCKDPMSTGGGGHEVYLCAQRKSPMCFSGSELSGRLDWHLWILCELVFVRCSKYTVHRRLTQMLSAHIFCKTVCLRILLIFSNFTLISFQINNTLQRKWIIWSLSACNLLSKGKCVSLISIWKI